MKTVKVFLENGDYFTTRMNETEAGIRQYCDGATLNMGKVNDNLQKVVSVEIMDEAEHDHEFYNFLWENTTLPPEELEELEKKWKEKHA